MLCLTHLLNALLGLTHIFFSFSFSSSSDDPCSSSHLLLFLSRLETTDDGLRALIRLSQGDMRKALNILQSTSMAFPVVDATSVYVCTATPLPEDIEAMVSWMLTESIVEAYTRA